MPACLPILFAVAQMTDSPSRSLHAVVNEFGEISHCTAVTCDASDPR
jgi:hypothetical protein